jgi:hypothetical protein
MEGDAAVGKLGFGALVLVVCAITMAVRKPPAPQAEPVSAPPVAIAAEAPPRIEYAKLPPAARPPQHRTAQPVRIAHSAPQRVHFVVATRRTARGSQPHYPFDPRHRWESRELP